VAETALIWVGFALLLALDLAVVATRVALLNSTHARMLSQGEPVDPNIRRALSLLRTPARLQASLNLLQIMLRFLTAGLILFIFWRQPGADSLLLGSVVLLLTALLVFLLEWVIRGLVLKDAEGWALRLGWFAHVLIAIFSPLVALPIAISGDERGSDDSASRPAVDELKSLVDAGQQEGLIERGERKMIYSIFELGDTLAREIMVPRIDMLALEALTPLPQAVDALLETGMTRVPVYEETIDKILGLLYAKDLLRVWRQGSQLDSLRDLVRPAYFVPEAKKADELLAEMQSQRIHMAVVVDEYGGVAGLVTLEDIVEEILGEIQDEYDQAEELPYQDLGEGEYIFQGRVDLDDFNEVMGSSLSKDEADTLGGYMYSRLGRVPATGEHVHVENLILTVEQVSGRRIRKVRARRNPPGAENEETIAHANR